MRLDSESVNTRKYSAALIFMSDVLPLLARSGPWLKFLVSSRLTRPDTDAL